MKKVKYFYNTHSLRYEKLEVPLRVKLLRVFGFFATALVTAAIIVWLGFRYIGSPNEQLLRRQLDDYEYNYTLLNKQVQELQQQIAELEKRDNRVYRAIFEANPVPDSARAKRTEKSMEVNLVSRLNDNELIRGTSEQLQNLFSRVSYQEKVTAKLMR